MAPDLHKHSPISVRLPADDRNWLKEHARRTGRAVNAILTRALAEYRERHDGDDRR